MCTSISYRKNNHYFGRNLDVEFSYNEKVVISPRNRYIKLKNGNDYISKYALIGMAAVIDDTPMYYDAANEKGLAMAGLNFPKNAYCNDYKDGMDNIALFELIPWILGQSETVEDAKVLLSRLNLTKDTFKPGLPAAQLHYMISDSKQSVVVEPVRDGLKIYDNPFDVMTNNPPFSYHVYNMQNYINLSSMNGKNKFSEQYDLENYCVGMGALGLPGDASSASRFVRAAFNLTNSYSDGSENDNISQFFHVLDSVAMVRGATLTDEGKNDYTIYSCCINTDKGIYYYKTYDNNQINAINLFNSDIDGKNIIVFDLNKEQNINFIN